MNIENFINDNVKFNLVKLFSLRQNNAILFQNVTLKVSPVYASFTIIENSLKFSSTKHFCKLDEYVHIKNILSEVQGQSFACFQVSTKPTKNFD